MLERKPFSCENIRTSLVNAEKVVKDPKNPIIKSGKRISLLFKLIAMNTPIR